MKDRCIGPMKTPPGEPNYGVVCHTHSEGKKEGQSRKHANNNKKSPTGTSRVVTDWENHGKG